MGIIAISEGGYADPPLHIDNVVDSLYSARVDASIRPIGNVVDSLYSARVDASIRPRYNIGAIIDSSYSQRSRLQSNEPGSIPGWQ